MRKWLTNQRKAAGLSMAALASEIGVTEGYVGQIESGIRAKKGLPVDLLVKIAQALGIDTGKVVQAEWDWLMEVRCERENP